MHSLTAKTEDLKTNSAQIHRRVRLQARLSYNAVQEAIAAMAFVKLQDVAMPPSQGSPWTHCPSSRAAIVIMELVILVLSFPRPCRPQVQDQ